MERFKVAMGFPMLATAVWLFWFTAPRFGKDGVLYLGLFLVVLAAASWTFGEFVQRGRKRRALSGVLAGLMLALGYAYFLEGQLHWRQPIDPASIGTGSSLRSSPDGVDWQVWSPEAVAAARSAGHPALVDFTADNCLNCKLNKITSLEIESTRARLKEGKFVAFLADFTDRDARIASILQTHERAGVPLVLVYPADVSKPPEVLPPVLTPDIVSAALDRAARSGK
jgi:thiol:disulfide interchange protein DsbD